MSCIKSLCSPYPKYIKNLYNSASATATTTKKTLIFEMGKGLKKRFFK